MQLYQALKAAGVTLAFGAAAYIGVHTTAYIQSEITEHTQFMQQKRYEQCLQNAEVRQHLDEQSLTEIQSIDELLK